MRHGRHTGYESPAERVLSEAEIKARKTSARQQFVAGQISKDQLRADLREIGCFESEISQVMESA